MKNLIWIFCLFSAPILAQPALKGTLTTIYEERIHGEIDLNSFMNSAQIHLDGKMKTFHASMIKNVTLRDLNQDSVEVERHFVSLVYRSNSFFDRTEFKLFEVVSDGEILFLRRVFEYDVFDSTDEFYIDEFYYKTGDQEIRKVKNFKRQILPLTKDKKDEIQIFRKENKIGNLNRPENMAAVVHYYNLLKAQ